MTDRERLMLLLANAKTIRRGCYCEYDYRCANCGNIVSLWLAIATLEPERGPSENSD